jgi:hypothetical protein
MAKKMLLSMGRIMGAKDERSMIAREDMFRRVEIFCRHV